MLTCAHKDLLEKLAQRHAAELKDSFRLARAQLGDHHPNVGMLAELIANAEAAERSIRALPVTPTRRLAG